MIFKKQISLLLAFLVLVSNTGLAFNIHYCEGKIASITSIFTKEEVCEIPLKQDSCCAILENNHKKCCSDKEVILKNKAEKEVIKTLALDFIPLLFNENSEKYFLSQTLILVKRANAYSFHANAPPLYQLYCQLTFYA